MTIVLEATALIAVAAAFVMVARAWPDLPDRVAVHFGISGRPDCWGPKWAVWLFPVLLVIIFGALESASYAAGHAPPKSGSHLSVGHLALFFAIVRLEVAGFFLYLIFQTLEVSLGREERIHPVALVIFPIALVTTALVLLRLH